MSYKGKHPVFDSVTTKTGVLFKKLQSSPLPTPANYVELFYRGGQWYYIDENGTELNLISSVALHKEHICYDYTESSKRSYLFQDGTVSQFNIRLEVELTDSNKNHFLFSDTEGVVTSVTNYKPKYRIDGDALVCAKTPDNSLWSSILSDNSLTPSKFIDFNVEDYFIVPFLLDGVSTDRSFIVFYIQDSDIKYKIVDKNGDIIHDAVWKTNNYDKFIINECYYDSYRNFCVISYDSGVIKTEQFEISQDYNTIALQSEIDHNLNITDFKDVWNINKTGITTNTIIQATDGVNDHIVTLNHSDTRIVSVVESNLIDLDTEFAFSDKVNAPYIYGLVLLGTDLDVIRFTEGDFTNKVIFKSFSNATKISSSNTLYFPCVIDDEFVNIGIFEDELLTTEESIVLHKNNQDYITIEVGSEIIKNDTALGTHKFLLEGNELKITSIYNTLDNRTLPNSWSTSNLPNIPFVHRWLSNYYIISNQPNNIYKFEDNVESILNLSNSGEVWQAIGTTNFIIALHLDGTDLNYKVFDVADTQVSSGSVPNTNTIIGIDWISGDSFIIYNNDFISLYNFDGIDLNLIWTKTSTNLGLVVNGISNVQVLSEDEVLLGTKTNLVTPSGGYMVLSTIDGTIADQFTEPCFDEVKVHILSEDNFLLYTFDNTVQQKITLYKKVSYGDYKPSISSDINSLVIPNNQLDTGMVSINNLQFLTFNGTDIYTNTIIYRNNEYTILNELSNTSTTNNSVVRNIYNNKISTNTRSDTLYPVSVNFNGADYSFQKFDFDFTYINQFDSFSQSVLSPDSILSYHKVSDDKYLLLFKNNDGEIKHILYELSGVLSILEEQLVEDQPSDDFHAFSLEDSTVVITYRISGIIKNKLIKYNSITNTVDFTSYDINELTEKISVCNIHDYIYIASKVGSIIGIHTLYTGIIDLEPQLTLSTNTINCTDDLFKIEASHSSIALVYNNTTTFVSSFDRDTVFVNEYDFETLLPDYKLIKDNDDNYVIVKDSSIPFRLGDDIELFDEIITEEYASLHHMIEDKVACGLGTDRKILSVGKSRLSEIHSSPYGDNVLNKVYSEYHNNTLLEVLNRSGIAYATENDITLSLNQGNWLGISREDISYNNLSLTTLKSGVNSSFVGLTPGLEHKNTDNFLLGQSISETEVQVRNNHDINKKPIVSTSVELQRIDESINIVNVDASVSRNIFGFNRVEREYQFSYNKNFKDIIKTEIIVNADTGTTIEFDPSSNIDSFKYIYFRCRDKDEDNNYSDWSSVSCFMFTNKYDAPVILFPSYDSENINTFPVVVVSDYSSVELGGTHTKTYIEIATDIGFNNIIYNTVLTSGVLTTHEVATELTAGQGYFIRAKFENDTLEQTNWSRINPFIVDSVLNTPNITTPSHLSIINDNTPTIQVSDFVNSLGTTHSKTYIQLSTDTNHVNKIIDIVLDSGDLNEYTITNPLANGVYYVRAKQIDSNGNETNWSDAVSGSGIHQGINQFEVSSLTELQFTEDVFLNESGLEGEEFDELEV